MPRWGFIKAGLLFDEYKDQTDAPPFLRERYQELRQRSGIVPHAAQLKERESKANALFLKGFGK